MLQVKPPLSPLKNFNAPHRARRHVTFSIVGTFIGLGVFLASALLPSLIQGGVAGAQVASLVYGVPQAHTFGVRAFIVAGITTAVFAFASLFAVVGAVAGASVGALTSHEGEP